MQSVAIRATGALVGLFSFFVLLGAPAALADSPGGTSGDGVVPILVDGTKSTCEALNNDPTNFPTVTSNFGFGRSGAGFLANGTYTFTTPPGNLQGGAPSDPNNSVTWSNVSSTKFDWTSTLPIDAVIVRTSGTGATNDVYVYVKEDTGDTNLTAPFNSGTPPALKTIAGITFCYDYELLVSKTANTSFTRDYDWRFKKNNDAPNPIVLSSGQTFQVNYDVTASIASTTDSGFMASGDITIRNPHPTLVANGLSVTDVIEPVPADPPNNISATVDCGGATTIAANSSLVCTYSANLPNSSDRRNVATATTTTTGLGSGQGSSPVKFENPTTVQDNCVTISDDKVDLVTPEVLGDVCATNPGTGQFQAPKTFLYSLDFTDEDCGANVNTAYLDSDDEVVAEGPTTVNVQCPPPETGCTLTQGYWKTHSEQGPAPYDDNWLNLSTLRSATLFFGTGKTWYEVFWSPPKNGNAYLILAHQYQAALLNQLNGASPVPPELAQAADLLDNYNTITPTLSKSVKNQMLSLAGILGAWNEGQSPPGHCSEDGTSSSSP
jgi:hypothetical protein